MNMNSYCLAHLSQLTLIVLMNNYKWGFLNWYEKLNMMTLEYQNFTNTSARVTPNTETIAQILSMSGSAYVCEQLFSIMKLSKTQFRSQLKDTR